MQKTHRQPRLVREWNNDEIAYATRSRSYTSPLKLGVVIGTYAAYPYIHLQFEARRRFYPNIPCLLHNDGPDVSEKLRVLCKQYGCDLEHNLERLAPHIGDLSVFVGGLQWAKQKSIDILLKISRRWIFRYDWTSSLTQLALNSQYNTYSSYCTAFNFGFRTECVALDVQMWGSSAFITPAVGRILSNESLFIEGYLHQYAQDFERCNNSAAEQWRTGHPMQADRKGYALWECMGTSRGEKSDKFLWHDSSGPGDYFLLSKAWDLPYGVEDFLDPNTI